MIRRPMRQGIPATTGRARTRFRRMGAAVAIKAAPMLRPARQRTKCAALQTQRTLASIPTERTTCSCRILIVARLHLKQWRRDQGLATTDLHQMMHPALECRQFLVFLCSLRVYILVRWGQQAALEKMQMSWPCRFKAGRPVYLVNQVSLFEAWPQKDCWVATFRSDFRR